MRFQNTVLNSLVKVVPRRDFRSLVGRLEGDRYVKSFDSWSHLMVLLFGQLSDVSSLREACAVWNARASHHYHLGAGTISRSTLADANRRRPSALFGALFSVLASQASRSLRRDGEAVLRLIDATPIPLADLCEWARWNGRTRGLKVHTVYDPKADRPVRVEITEATVNDVVVARAWPIEPGTTLVFDKAYADYAWWHRLHQAGCRFVTRPKTNVPFTTVRQRALGPDASAAGILSDTVVRLASQKKAVLPIELRRIEVRRDDGRVLVVVSNDLERSALAIAGLYRQRWQIELLFRWIKQHLKIRAFLGRSENAIRLQIYAALIAYLLLRMAAAQSRLKINPLRFIDLAKARLFERVPIERIDKPPERTTAATIRDPRQMQIAYA